MEFDSPDSAVLSNGLVASTVSGGGAATLVSERVEAPSPTTPALTVDESRDELIARISRRIQRRVKNLCVAVDAVGTTVTAEAGSWHDRQLIEQAVLKEVTGAVTIDVRVRG